MQTIEHGSIAVAFNKWWDYRYLLRNLVAKEIKVRYQGAALGFAWSLVNPLMVTLMYLFIFTYVFRNSLPHYALYMVTGIVHWTLFSTLALQASELLTGNSSLLQKVYFPRLLIPVANLGVNLVLWFMALGVYAALYAPLGGGLNWALLAYPLYLALFVGFSFGVMLTLAVLYVDFRDLKHLVEVLIQLLFWGTPIVYSLGVLPDHVKLLIKASPLAESIIAFQDIFWRGQLPTWHITAALLGWTAISLAVGLILFYRRGAYLIERL